MLTRIDVIKYLIKRFDYKTYLEIGVQDLPCWNAVDIEKTGVDIFLYPDQRIFPYGSDNFFEQNKKTFDLIFIDGDHNYGQVIKDIRNAFKVLNEGGSVVCHDAIPEFKEHTNPYVNGTVYQALCEIRSEEGYDFVTCNWDFGVCIIRRGNMKPLNCKGISYEEYMERKQEILNLVDVLKL